MEAAQLGPAEPAAASPSPSPSPRDARDAQEQEQERRGAGDATVGSASGPGVPCQRGPGLKGRHGPAPTSGELLLRSGFAGSAHRGAWEGVFAPFEGLLGAGSSALDASRLHDCVVAELETSRDCVRKLREHRLRSMAGRLRRTQGGVDDALARLSLEHDEARARAADERAALDDELLTLAAHFAACVRKEQRLVAARQRTAEQASLRWLRDRAAALALEEFALHLLHESGRQVRLTRLPHSNAQFLRCKRATCDNVRPDFFGAKAHYSGVSVLDVFNVENGPMFRAFQQRAARLKSGSVKGLFCQVPAAALERLVVQGMLPDCPVAFSRAHAAPPAPATQPAPAASADVAVDVAASVDVAADVVASTATFSSVRGAGVAEAKVLAADAVPFPCTFSRWSTLEADRDFVERDGDGACDSEPRYLALCRVIMGNVFSTSSDYKGFPNVPAPAPAPAPQAGTTAAPQLGATPQFDAMYSAAQGEYRALNASLVMPEFIIRCQYTGRYASPIVEAEAEAEAEAEVEVKEARAGIEPDFSVATCAAAGPEALAAERERRRQCDAGVLAPELLPRVAGLPLQASRLDEAVGAAAERRRLKERQLLEAEEMQIGIDTLLANAARQRAQLSASIADALGLPLEPQVGEA